MRFAMLAQGFTPKNLSLTGCGQASPGAVDCGAREQLWPDNRPTSTDGKSVFLALKNPVTSTSTLCLYCLK